MQIALHNGRAFGAVFGRCCFRHLDTSSYSSNNTFDFFFVFYKVYNIIYLGKTSMNTVLLNNVIRTVPEKTGESVIGFLLRSGPTTRGGVKPVY